MTPCPYQVITYHTISYIHSWWTLRSTNHGVNTSWKHAYSRHKPQPKASIRNSLRPVETGPVPLKTVSFKWICSSSDWCLRNEEIHPNHFTCILTDLTASGPKKGTLGNQHRNMVKPWWNPILKKPEGWSPEMKLANHSKTYHAGELKASSFRFVGLENFTWAACWEIFVFWNVTERVVF